MKRLTRGRLYNGRLFRGRLLAGVRVKATDWGGIFRRYGDQGRDFLRAENARVLKRTEPGRDFGRDHDTGRRVPRNSDMGRVFAGPDSSAKGGA